MWGIWIGIKGQISYIIFAKQYQKKKGRANLKTDLKGEGRESHLKSW
jgi:hypothetical protein